VPPPTINLYRDDHCLEADAQVMAIQENAFACDRTCFYPGGGGQPPDEGRAMLSGGHVVEIVSVHDDAEAAFGTRLKKPCHRV